jgi:hypothetical protein
MTQQVVLTQMTMVATTSGKANFGIGTSLKMKTQLLLDMIDDSHL